MRWSKVFSVVDCHAEGESGKVVVGGVGKIPGETMFDKRQYLEAHRDDIRKLVLFEPRGAVWHNANIILPSNNPEADMGFVILESTEYPAMSGSNTMCVATVLLETGILPMQEPVTNLVLESPAGLIKVRCDCKDGKVTKATLVNQPAFCYYTEATIEVPGVGSLVVDVSYGGMTYVLVDAPALGLQLNPSEARDLVDLGQRIKTAAAEQLEVSHPLNPEIPGITQTEFTGPLRRENGVLVSKNAVIVSPGRCDRSPCGTGSSARLASLYAKGQIKEGELLVHESITGSRFDCSVVGTTKVGKYDAVIPSIGGQAWVTGLYQMGIDPTDPYQNGFTLSDTWFQAL
ncbi:proline racemase family protein [Pseudomonas sp. MOB-449]|nr:proline racemase family protein [Pseudomonas sp. MOB-449]